MARDIEHVVDASGDPVVTVLVAPCAVAGEVHAWEGREVGLDEPIVRTVDSAHLTRPAIRYHEFPLACSLEHLALVVDDCGLDAEERQGCRARFEIRRTG